MRFFVPRKYYVLVSLLLFLTPLSSQKEMKDKSFGNDINVDNQCTNNPLHPDYEVLSRFYSTTVGAQWTNNSNWLSCNPCSWYGIECSGNRVTEVRLPNNNIAGIFVIEPGELEELREIDLSDNQVFFGFENINEIPRFITYVDLANNISTDVLAVFNAMEFLTHLNLSGNTISANLSSALDNIDRMEYLNVSDNYLYGSFPSYFGNLGSLGYLDLSDNAFEGCIPSSYSSLCSIKNNVFLDDNCNRGVPVFSDWCDGATCSMNIQLEGPSESCIGQEITITAPEGYDNYEWSVPCGGGSLRSLLDFNYTMGLCPGDYSVTMTTTKGCEVVASISVASYEEPEQFTETQFCEDGSVTVSGVTFDSEGTFAVSQTTTENCSYTLWVTATEIPRPKRTVNFNICEGDTESLHGQTYDTEGSFTQNVNNPSGCDSLLTVNVSFLDSYSYTENYSTCTGTEIVHDGVSYGVGSYTVPYEAANGCDSIVNISVAELLASYPEESYLICNGQTVDVNGEVYTEGQHEQPFINSEGCESILYIDVEGTPAYNVSEEILMCDDIPVTYLVDYTYTEGGDYVIPMVDENGCNYNVLLHIEEAESTVEEVFLVKCDGVAPEYNGQSYPFSKTRYYTNDAGCDSTLIVHVTPAMASDTTLTFAPICSPAVVTVNGMEYNYTDVFVQHLENAAGCDSTIYIDVTVNIDRTRKIEFEICPGQSITINEFTYDSPGGYAQFLNTEGGCDSTLRITIKETDLITEENYVRLCGNETYSENGITYSATGVDELMFTTADGCDSLYTLTVEKYEHTSYTVNDRLCTGDKLTYNGEDFLEGGLFFQTLTNSNGCDSILTIDITEYSPSVKNVQRETCEGTPWVENGFSYTSTGVYKQKIPNAVNCDSTITIDLIVYENTEEDMSLQVCRDQTREVNGEAYDEAGTFMQEFTNAEGCDSTLIIVVTIVDEIRATYKEELCEGETTTINGEAFSTTRTTEQFFTSSIGCDSILTVSVIVHQDDEESIEDEVCTGSELVINGITYLTGGVKTQNLQTSKGCDSTLTIIVEELSPSSFTESFEMCEGDPLTINGVPYGFGGIFEQYYTNAVGCDSTYYIDILEHPDTEHTEFRFLCPGETVTVNSESYTVPAIYQQSYTNSQGCDSTLFINVQYSPPKDTTIYDFICEEGSYEFMGETLLAAGEYPFYTLTSRGCDSTIILNLGQLTGEDTTIYRSICAGDFYTFGTKKLYASNSYFDEIIIGGCKTPTTLILDVLQPTEGFRTVHKCEGELFWVNGKYESEEGFYNETITSQAGCDSIITSQLIYEEHKETIVDTMICEGSTVFFSNWIYDEPGNYRITRKSEFGCDSIIKLNIELYDTIPDIFEFQVCEGEKIEFESMSYGVGNYEGEYFDGICFQDYLLIVSETDLLQSNETITICPGEDVDFLDMSFDHAGQFYIGQETGECEFTEYLTVLEAHTEGSLSFVFLCEGSDLKVGDQEITENGVYDIEVCGAVSQYNVSMINGDDKYMEKTINPEQQIVIEGVVYSEAGTYEIQVGESAGCPSRLFLTIIVEACGGERAIALTLCDGERYQFFDKEISEAGDYIYEKSLGFGCDSLISLDILFSKAEDFAIEGTTILCEGEEILLEGPAGYDYLWSNGDESQSITVEKAGLYSLTIENEIGCSNYDEIMIQEVTFPQVIDLIRIEPKSCEIGDGSIIVEVENEEHYQYSIDGGISWHQSPEFTGLEAGDYAVLLADLSLTCFTSFALPITLENKGIPKISSIDIEEANSCTGKQGSINIHSEWSTALLYSVNDGTDWSENSDFQGLAEGKYQILVSPVGSSCVNDFTDTVEIKNIGVLEVETGIEQELSCESSEDASISVKVLAGQEPYSYFWSTGESSQTISGLSAGLYSVIVEDANGCVQEKEVEVDEIILDVVLEEFRDTILCSGDTIEITDLDSSYQYFLFKEDVFLGEGVGFVISESGHYQIIADRGSECFTEKDFVVEDPDLESYGLEFLLSSQGFVGNEVILVNVSDPIPENFAWNYDTLLVNMEQIDSFSHRLEFLEEGIYDIEFQSLIEECQILLSKQIEIFSDSTDIDYGSESVLYEPRLESWKVSPNPNIGQFNVEVNLSEIGTITLALYDMFGSKIGSQRLDGKTTFNKDYNLPNLGTGIYSIVLIHEEQVFQKSILIIR